MVLFFSSFYWHVVSVAAKLMLWTVKEWDIWVMCLFSNHWPFDELLSTPIFQMLACISVFIFLNDFSLSSLQSSTLLSLTKLNPSSRWAALLYFLDTTKRRKKFWKAQSILNEISHCRTICAFYCIDHLRSNRKRCEF